jgi:hypothetical protein
MVPGANTKVHGSAPYTGDVHVIHFDSKKKDNDGCSPSENSQDMGLERKWCRRKTTEVH